MINLTAKKGQVKNPSTSEPIIGRISKNANLPASIRDKYILILDDSSKIESNGFLAYIRFGEEIASISSSRDVFTLPETMSYLQEGDVIKLNPSTGGVRAIHRKSAHHNALLVTEQCNSFCLMCSQPPRKINDSYLVNELERAIPLIDTNATEICLSGGEPTLLGDSLFSLINKIKLYLPQTSLHVLTNGRKFKNLELAKRLQDINHPDLMLGIPLYSDVSDIHDFVVQAKGAFDETIRGILNLKSQGLRVELRVVIHKQTYKRLPNLAEFICRNLTFVDHVALMGLEITGFTKVNLDALWVDPCEYQSELTEATHLLDKFRIHTSVYNHQLCLLDESLHKFSVKSISDWKNEYMPECAGCTKMNECGGFFSSAIIKYSNNIKPYF